MSETKTLASQPLTNTVAISTPSELNYNEIVRRNAKRKSDNGAQFSSTKGKTSLLLCVLDDVRSQLGIPKFDENNKRTSLSDDVFQKAKQALESFWHTSAKDMVQRAIDNDARITVREGVLMSRIGKGDKIIRSKTDKLTAVYNPTEKEYKLCDTIGLIAAQNRMDVMLDNVGKWSREELAEQKKKIELLEKAIG